MYSYEKLISTFREYLFIFTPFPHFIIHTTNTYEYNLFIPRYEK